MKKNAAQLFIGLMVLAISVGAQVYGVDIAAALVPAGALLAYLSGYNTLNPNLHSTEESTDE